MKVEILKKIIYGRQCITINVHFGFLTFYDKFVHTYCISITAKHLKNMQFY